MVPLSLVARRMEQITDVLHDAGIPADSVTAVALHWMGCTGMLRDGVTLEQLLEQSRTKAAGVLHQLRQEYARPREREGGP